MASSPGFRVTTTTDGTEACTKLESAIREALPSGEIIRENVRSFYWWDDDVQNEEEIRLTFDTTTSDFSHVVNVLADAHTYDVPMIVGEALDENLTNDAAVHVKGTIVAGAQAASLASSLAKSRLVACAQINEQDGTLQLKTTRAAMARIGERVEVEAVAAGVAIPSIMWRPIVGNGPYLAWVTEETNNELWCEA